MFLEQYKNTFNPNSGDVFEKNSIRNEPLFGLNEYYSPEYLASDYLIKVKDIGECQNELENVLQKFKFISSYLTQYKALMVTESMKLDDEFNKINNLVSTKGESFLNMFQLTDVYNYVFDGNTTYTKNVVKLENDYIKSSAKSASVDYYIDYVDDNSFFIVFKNLYQVSDILLDFYNDYKISIFGGTNDDVLENIVSDVDSNKKLFINNNKSLYKKLFVISDKVITKYIKKIKILASVENKKNENGFIIRDLNNLNKISNFIIASDSNTSFYLYDKETYTRLLLNLASGDENKLINENYKIEVNSDIQNTFGKDKMYLLEVLNRNTNISTIPRLFGKEKINK